MKKGILLIGFGNMGSAIYRGLLQVIPEEKIFICESSNDKTSDLNRSQVGSDINQFLDNVDTIILAVKPQSFSELAESIKVDLRDKMVISIMAGVSLGRLSAGLNCPKIVRSMPNLNIQVGNGLIGWIATSAVLDLEKTLLKEMFQAFGEEVEVFEESMIDKITALSGSGPAYFFRLSELMTEQAKEFGFTDEQARKIGESTFIGAGKLLAENDKSAKWWREAVTSKGGTTEAALNYLKSNEFDKIFKEAISKAKERSEELNS